MYLIRFIFLFWLGIKAILAKEDEPLFVPAFPGDIDTISFKTGGGRSENLCKGDSALKKACAVSSLIEKSKNEPYPELSEKSILGGDISEDDLSNLRFPLVRYGKLLPFSTLKKAPHGRHLLVLSLLENFEEPYWVPRVNGSIQLYLPNDLKHDLQPMLPPNAWVLDEVILDNKILTRDDLFSIFRPQLTLGPNFKDEIIIKFHPGHMKKINFLVDQISKFKDFGSFFSVLVVLRDMVSYRLFIHILSGVISTREDVGYVLPSPEVNPYDFLPMRPLKQQLHEMEYESGRTKRQVSSQQNLFVNWSDPIFQTIPSNDPESRLAYFREDIKIQFHHYSWHIVLSVPAAGRIDRRGEMFAYMHKQLLARYNLERLSVGLGPVTAYDRERWGQPLSPGYDPKLDTGVGETPFAARPYGTVMATELIQDLENMEFYLNYLASTLGEYGGYYLFSPERWNWLPQSEGKDHGITLMGDFIEANTSHQFYGNYHNTGHMYMSWLHLGGQMNQGSMRSVGVLALPATACRDPAFFMWHKHIDDVLMRYKNYLPAYTNWDLNFPGVSIEAVNVQSYMQQANNNWLYTYIDAGRVRMPSADFFFRREGIDMVYDELNHVPFSYNIRINSRAATQGIVRIFLLPGDERWYGGDLTQSAVELDRFFVRLNQGNNNIRRESSVSSTINKSRRSLSELLEDLLQGRMTGAQFAWAGCGWPQEMLLPRGNFEGQRYQLFVAVTPLLDSDRSMTEMWERLSRTSWTWCGVRPEDGDVPDGRPMGFPLDRIPPGNTLNSLLQDNNVPRRNMARQQVVIRHYGRQRPPM